MATYSKTIICLANSWKLGARCIAGKVVTPQGFGEWIRPIGTADHGAVSYQDRHYDGGADPALLDVIEIQMSSKSQHAFQVENHNIDNQWYWRLVRRAAPAELDKALDPLQRDLWGTSLFSSGSGANDRVAEHIAPNFGYSLRLIHVADLEIRVSVENPSFTNKKTVRGYFTYSGARYGLAVTDPETRSLYISRPEATYPVGAAILCVSLGEPLNGYVYKLIAGVFLP
ncbi:conserved protein of unknown function (plasmid) [Rhodovastum atsumiense]|uniref:Dual OB-containing domain-containing protein n=1 Tax=Rhodovastum atsumiense TaxID=504468 RepID=A0A5M6IUI1_9PROT|nr:hypothetical protein [Rhodovastum atsumiense]KAA5611609.1 hypothetical protein F1189_13685 [Rhodovastum atsumiense]CAH2606306.1 conserved protein of unknown function [Rhodovastum atsumiense]